MFFSNPVYKLCLLLWDFEKKNFFFWILCEEPSLPFSVAPCACVPSELLLLKILVHLLPRGFLLWLLYWRSLPPSTLLKHGCPLRSSSHTFLFSFCICSCRVACPVSTVRLGTSVQAVCFVHCSLASWGTVSTSSWYVVYFSSSILIWMLPSMYGKKYWFPVTLVIGSFLFKSTLKIKTRNWLKAGVDRLFL